MTMIIKKFAALAAVVLPWVIVISFQAGHPCVSTCGRSGKAWGPLSPNGPLPVHMLQRPRDGRITGWENPIEIARPWPTWEGNGIGPMEGLLRIVQLNGVQLFNGLRNLDSLSLLLLAWVAGGVMMFPWRKTLGDRRRMLRAWAWLSATLYLAGFLPLWVFDRFLWPVWGLLTAMACSILHRIAIRESQPAGVARRIVAAGLAAVLLASIAVRTACVLWGPEGHFRKGREASWLHREAVSLGGGGGPPGLAVFARRALAGEGPQELG